jgi:hypothetical protein
VTSTETDKSTTTVEETNSEDDEADVIPTQKDRYPSGNPAIDIEVKPMQSDGNSDER